jgi:hypothetical protein
MEALAFLFVWMRFLQTVIGTGAANRGQMLAMRKTSQDLTDLSR